MNDLILSIGDLNIKLNTNKPWLISKNIAIITKVQVIDYQQSLITISFEYNKNSYDFFYNGSKPFVIIKSYKWYLDKVHISIKIEDIINAFLTSEVTKNLNLIELKNILPQKHLILL
jgi:hypothetical protein